MSTSTIQLLGSKLGMDYELWTSRLQSSDREWFAGPLVERGLFRPTWARNHVDHDLGTREFSHFNLTCVGFQQATSQTSVQFTESKKLSHTVRLVRLMDPLNSKLCVSLCTVI
jgi:hypothetical protein